MKPGLPALLHLCRLGILCLLFAGRAGAECSQWPLLSRLAYIGYSTDNLHSPPRSEFNLLHDDIAALDRAELQSRLNTVGHGGSYATIFLFLADMSVLTSAGAGGHIEHFEKFVSSDVFRLRWNLVREVLAESCAELGEERHYRAQALQETPPIKAGAATGQGAGSDGPVPGNGSGRDQIRSVGGTLKQVPIRKYGPTAIETGNFKADQILRLIFFLVIAYAAGMCLLTFTHYLLIWSRVIRRYRMTCDVPAVVKCMMQEIPGRICVIGKLGCVFEPDAGALEGVGEGLNQGMFCAVQVEGGPVLHAKLLQDADETISLRFKVDRTKAQVQAVLAHSAIRPRMDLKPKARGTGGKSRFGWGPMVKAG